MIPLLYCEDQQEDEEQGLSVVPVWHAVNAQRIVMTLISISFGQPKLGYRGEQAGTDQLGKRSWHWEANNTTRAISSEDDSARGRTSDGENNCNRSPETNPSRRAAPDPTGGQHPASSLPSQVLLLSFPPLFGMVCLLSSKSPVQETRRSRNRQK